MGHITAISLWIHIKQKSIASAWQATIHHAAQLCFWKWSTDNQKRALFTPESEELPGQLLKALWGNSLCMKCPQCGGTGNGSVAAKPKSNDCIHCCCCSNFPLNQRWFCASLYHLSWRLSTASESFLFRADLPIGTPRVQPRWFRKKKRASSLLFLVNLSVYFCHSIGSGANAI